MPVKSNDIGLRKEAKRGSRGPTGLVTSPNASSPTDLFQRSDLHEAEQREVRELMTMLSSGAPSNRARRPTTPTASFNGGKRALPMGSPEM